MISTAGRRHEKKICILLVVLTNSDLKALACVVMQRRAERKQNLAGPYSVCLLSTAEKLFEKLLFFSLDQSPCWVFLLLNREDYLRFNLRAVTLRGASCSCYFCGL